MKTSKTFSKAITKEMLEQKDAENSKDQECSQRPSREHQPKRTQQEQRLHITPQSKTSQTFNYLSELANSIYLKIKDDTKEFKNRENITFNKIQPNKEDLQALNEIAEALVTTQPETDPTLYLWEINCAISATAVAWKNYTGNKGKPKTNVATDERPKWMSIIDNQITNLRKQTSQITEEKRRLTTNGKLTSKLRKSRKWMRSEIKDKITKQRLQELKERKINQLRTKKIQRKRKLTSHKRRIANKQFDRSESKFYDHCWNIIKSDINNEKPTYTDKIRQQSTTDDSSSLKVNDFNDFWRPVWETEKKANLEAKVMKGVVSTETVVLRRWGSSIQKFGFINGVDNVNWPP